MSESGDPDQLRDDFAARLRCHACGRVDAADARTWRCACGGLFDLAPPPTHPAELVRADDRGERSLWRFASWLPVGLAPTASRLSMGEGVTPMVRGDDTTWFKLEYVAPTGAFKDRGAVVLVAVAVALGARALVADSSGNSGTAIAAYAARAGLSCTVFVPGDTSEKKLRQMRAHGAVVIANGTREDAAAAAIEMVTREGSFYASHVYSPFFFEGTKTYLLEILERLGRLPDRLVLPVGNGTLVLGVARALDELKAADLVTATPELVLVQSAACAPLAEAFQRGGSTVSATTNRGTIAEGIAIAAPPRGIQLLEIARRYGATVVAVDDDAIRAAADRLARQGLYVEPTAAAPLAGLRTAIDDGRLDSSLVTVVPLSGTGLKAR